LTKRNVTKMAKYPSPHNLFELFDNDDQDYSANNSDFLSQVMELNYTAVQSPSWCAWNFRKVKKLFFSF